MQIQWTRTRIVTCGVTVVVVGALLALLWVRLLAAGQATSTIAVSPLEGRAAPNFTVTLYNGTPGQKIRLADLKGHPVVINFWASWCDPCREETPMLEAAWQKYQKDGVIFVGVDYQDKPDAARAFMQQYGITYPVGPDDANGDIAIAYGVSGTPESAFVDRNGVVALKWGGMLDDRTLNQTIQKLLKT